MYQICIKYLSNLYQIFIKYLSNNIYTFNKCTYTILFSLLSAPSSESQFLLGVTCAAV